MLKVTNEVTTYDEPAKPTIRVHSHWNQPALVIIEIEGKEATVDVGEITAAIRNASNTGR